MGDNGIILEENLLHKYDQDIVGLIEKIWLKVSSPCSIYIRGSYANLDREFTPWDLDIYLITYKNEIIDNIKVSKALDKEYPNLPELDLTIISKQDIFELEEHILKKLLLIYGSNLVKGEPLKHIISSPMLDKDTSYKVKKIMYSYVSTKLSEMKLKINTEDKEVLYFLSKKIAKMLVRTGVFIGIEEHNLFSRDITYCYQNLVNKYPDLEKYADEMYGVLGGNYMDFTEFLYSAEKIKNTIYNEIEFTEK